MKYFTKLTALLLALLLIQSLLPVSVLAAGNSPTVQATAEDKTEPTIIDSGRYGSNLTWTVTDDYVLTISGSGEMAHNSGYSCTEFPWHIYHDDVVKIVLMKGITSISAFAFYDFSAVTEVCLPEGLTRIRQDAFKKCASLREIHFPSSLNRIDNHAFKLCRSLTSLYIPSTVTYIGAEAFKKCRGLKELVIAGDRNYLGNSFIYCTSLTDVVFLGKIKNLEDTFPYCSSLKEIALPEGCEALYSNTFRYCTSLERVVFPASVKTIEKETFLGCSALTDKYYPASYERWKQVEVADGNTYLKRAKLHAYYNFNYLSNCEVSEPKYSVYACTGLEVRPLIRVYTASGTRLKEGTNYSVSYENNIDPGTAAVTVTGIGKYIGSVTRTFEILPRLPNLRIEDCGADTATVKWTEDPQAVRYQVYLDSNLAGETTDTELVLSDLDGKSHDIEVRSIWKNTSASGDVEEHIGLSAKVRLNSVADCRCTRRYSYYHSTTTPPVTVKTQKGTLLKKGLNYTVSYQRTEETDGYGTPMYRITITGIGKYYGVHDLYFYYGRRPKASYGGDA